MGKQQKRAKKQHFDWGQALFWAAVLVIGCLIGRTILFLDVAGTAFPHWDEWRFQNDKSFMATIFTLNNENFQVFTNALFWLAPRIGLPFWGLRYVSFGVFLLMVWVLYRRLRPLVPIERRFMLVLAFCPFFSAFMCGNLLWTVLSQTWVFFLFMFLAVKYGFELPQTPRHQIVTWSLVFGACLAMNVTLPLIFALLYALRACFLEKKLKPRQRYMELIGAVLMMIMTLLIYFYICQREAATVSLASLFNASYWLWLSYGLTGLWNGFLVSAEQVWFYYIIGGLTALVLALLFYRQIQDKKRQAGWVLLLLIVGGMAMIILLRGAYILEITDHVVRHIVYSVLLIPVIYVLGVGDKHKVVRLMADVWLVIVLICGWPTFAAERMHKVAEFTRVGDACLVAHLRLSQNNEEFTCGRYFDDIREPLHYFVTHDAAFRQYYQNNLDGATGGEVPYHFKGKVFYRIVGKNILLFR